MMDSRYSQSWREKGGGKGRCLLYSGSSDLRRWWTNIPKTIFHVLAKAEGLQGNARDLGGGEWATHMGSWSPGG